MKRFSSNVIFFLVVLAAFAAVCRYRDNGFGGPHHDEVIGLLAANGSETKYQEMLSSGTSPLNEVAPASVWHAFTQHSEPATFSEIRSDVFNGDKHPPLAFWLLNRWLRLFDHGGYAQAVVFVWLQVLVAAFILFAAVLRHTRNHKIAFLACGMFLAGNSAIFTAIWVRQYALFVVCYAVLVAVSGELTRKAIRPLQNLMLLGAIGGACLAGMMTQYTFVTMSLPIHVMLLIQLTLQKQWRQLSLVLGTYSISAGVFLWLMPGVFDHATAVSEGQQLQWHLTDALQGLPRMVIPMPSTVPHWFIVLAGSCTLIVPLCLAWFVCRAVEKNLISDRPDPRIPLSGMLGAGVIQFVMVAVGLFPGWATGENHMCSFWLLTVFAIALFLNRSPNSRLKRWAVSLGIVGMLGMQALYGWHCHRILPRVNTSYIQSQPHDLVAVDNLARGFVLQITDLVPADENVLATESRQLAARFANGSLQDFKKILYLPMDSSVRDGKATVIAAAVSKGWTVIELPVVHTAMYEAVLFEH